MTDELGLLLARRRAGYTLWAFESREELMTGLIWRVPIEEHKVVVAEPATNDGCLTVDAVCSTGAYETIPGKRAKKV